jgi:threonine dehydrogenase-like Zn-dependent dehydrogenase
LSQEGASEGIGKGVDAAILRVRRTRSDQLGEAPEPHAGPGQIRILVKAASVNGADWKYRSGIYAQDKPLKGTGYLGTTPLGLSMKSGMG